MKFVAGFRECRQDCVHAQVGAETAIDGEFIVSEDFHFAQAQAALHAHQLYGHILADEWSCAGECFCDALLDSAWIPGAEWVALQIGAAVANTYLEVLQGLVAAAATCGNAHYAHSLWC